MANFIGECISGLCGICCLTISSEFTRWSYTSRPGESGCCCSGRNAGCCGCCCDEKFNEDGFEEQNKRDLDKTGDPLDEQLQKTPKMTVSSSGGEPQAQTSERNDEKESIAMRQTDAAVRRISISA